MANECTRNNNGLSNSIFQNFGAEWVLILPKLFPHSCNIVATFMQLAEA